MTRIIILLIVSTVLLSCKKKSLYHQTVKKELATGIKQDSLFLGFYFGMESQDFYNKCWELNKAGLAREGAQNTTVYQEITDLDYKAGFEFYPLFKNDKIQSMIGYIHYIGWSPWSKHLWPDKLIEDVKDLFEEWYGPGFFSIKSPGRGKAYVKIDGNRRIVLYHNKDQRIEFLFSDLSDPDDILKMANKNRN